MTRMYPAIALLAANLLSTQPAAVAQIMAKYGVDSRTAAIILAQQGPLQMQEGGRVEEQEFGPTVPQYASPGLPEGMTWQEQEDLAREEDMMRTLPDMQRSGLLRLNPDAFERWLAGLAESENVEDLRTPFSDPANISGARFKKAADEVEEINREADRIKAERERREREEKHSETIKKR